MRNRLCEYCGKPTWSARTYHRMCLIDDVYDCILNGKPLTSKLGGRLYACGLSAKEIKKDVEEDKMGRIK